MRHHLLVCAGVVLAVALPGAQAPKPVQKSAAPARAKTVPKPLRLVDGRPDLQGTWDFAQLTPFERPDALGTKSSFASDDEAEEFAQETQAKKPNMDRRDGGAAA